MYKNHMGINLIWDDTADDDIAYGNTVLTMLDYIKWYDLHIVDPDGKVTEITPNNLTDFAPDGWHHWGDHVPNPDAVANFAEDRDFAVCGAALGEIERRWNAR